MTRMMKVLQMRPSVCGNISNISDEEQYMNETGARGAQSDKAKAEQSKGAGQKKPK